VTKIFVKLGMSILIGGLLGGIAMFLIKMNKDALLGRAIPLQTQEKISKMLKEDPCILEVRDIKAVLVGESIRYKAEVKWNGAVIARKYLALKGLGQACTNLAIPAENEKKFEEYLIEFGEDLTKYAAQELDRVEKRIKDEIPQVRHLDLESDA